MSKVKLSVKWGKELFPDVEVDTSEPPLVFKSQLFALSGVPPDRQKVMVKGTLLKDEEWGKATPKEGMTVMLMGSAKAVAVEAPKQALVFMEDLPEDEQDALATKAYGSGLQNLGNTCYMNSTVQFLYSIDPLKSSLSSFSHPPGSSDTSSKLLMATKALFKDLERGGAPFPPYEFLMALRQKFPQFSQQTSSGVPMQQDAEECLTNIVYTLREKLKDNEASVMEKLLGIRTRLKLKSEESGEEMEEESLSYVLKCNIDNDTNHLHTGLELGLRDDREKTSQALGRVVKFKGSSLITHLPPYLTVQLMRFFYRVDTQQKAKILRKVTFPLELDVFDFCTPELKAQLEGPRAAYKAEQDRLIEATKLAKNKGAAGTGKDSKAETEAPAAAAAPAAVAGDAAGASAGVSAAAEDVEMKDAADAAPSTSGGSSAPLLTGKYELQGVLTHKGRSADSGHYVSWVKQKDGSWVLFDDDKIIPKTADEVLALSGGGDWHMAYMLLYKAITAPAVAQAAAATPAPGEASGSGSAAAV